MLQVVDNGVGGADASAGSGLAGLAERLDAVDGILVVDSPVGGPDPDHGGAALAGLSRPCGRRRVAGRLRAPGATPARNWGAPHPDRPSSPRPLGPSSGSTPPRLIRAVPRAPSRVADCWRLPRPDLSRSECWDAGVDVRAVGGREIVEDRVRVVIAEDSVLLREGLTRLLTDRGHDVVAGRRATARR